MNEVGEILTRESRARDSSPHVEGSLPLDNTAVLGNGRFELFQVVFRPAILCMLCVMMFLREGWIVGNAGILGTALIILLTFFLVGSAALVLSSVYTNARAGDRGILSIVGRSLGFEAGGSIGFPLYLGHVFAVALFVYAFAEAWQYIFPGHSLVLVAYLSFSVIVAASFLAPNIVSRFEDIGLGIVVISLGSILLGLTSASGSGMVREPELWGAFRNSGFWVLFAVFFAAGTGAVMGFSERGILRESRKSIPRGIFTAMAIGFVVYLLMAVWYSRAASPSELISNYLIVVDRAAWGPVVLAAILTSTFTAAVITLISAAQMLHALGIQDMVPGPFSWSRALASGKPKTILAVTTLLVLVTLLLGSLDRIAVLVTMFFLLSFVTIHVVVIFEQSHGLFSFRPILSLPRWVPYLGAASCFLVMFVLSPFFAMIGLVSVFGIFVYLSRRTLPANRHIVRSGTLAALADRVTAQIIRAPEEDSERSWRPKLIVPVKARSHLDGTYRFLRLITEPVGSVHILGVDRPSTTSGSSRGAVLGLADRDLFGPKAKREEASNGGSTPGDTESPPETPPDLGSLSAATEVIQSDTLYAQATVIEASTLSKGFETTVSILRNSYSRPNLVLGLAHLYNQETMQGLVDVAGEFEMGAALLFLHPEAALGYERIVNVWVSDQSPDWELGLRLENLDLALLLAIQISRNMGARLRLSTLFDDPEQASNARDFLDRLIHDARLPSETEVSAARGTLLEEVGNAPKADLHVLPLSKDVHHAFLTTLVRRSGSSFLFVRDSGRESVLA